MITDPVVSIDLFHRSPLSDPAVVRGFSHVSPGWPPGAHENSPGRQGSTARSIGGTKLLRARVFGVRLALTLPSGHDH